VPYLVAESSPDPQTSEQAIGIYKAKMKNVGERASDCVDIAKLCFSNYIQTPSEGLALKKAKIYAEKALEIKAQLVEGLIILASCHIAMGEYPQAVRILASIPEPDGFHMKAMVINNRGIARILNGERETGVSDLRKAAEFEYPETMNALQELGLDQE
jgi:lipopolysaccharide biosynthesis regulator YciM